MAQFYKGRNNLSSKANRSLIAGLGFFVLVMASFYVVFGHQVQVAKWYYFWVWRQGRKFGTDSGFKSS